MYRKININSKIFYDIIIIGGGHSGIEAAYITNKLNMKVLLITEDINNIGMISCNPSIGGVGKDNLIKELNNLGGIMGKYANLTSTNLQLLNKTKKNINHSKRLQIDKILYSLNVRKVLSSNKITIIELKIKNIIKINIYYNGIITNDNQKFFSKYILISTGTFINRKIYNGLYFNKKRNYFNKEFTKVFKYHKKFKTGTPPRLIKESINLNHIKKHKQIKPIPYIKNINNDNIKRKFIPFWVTKINNNTINIIRKYIKYSTRYSGLIKCKGPRYCPSIEDKISMYNKNNHNIFLERESITNNIIYPSGLSLSMPNTIQNIIINSIKDLNNSLITKYGFNIEYTYLNPRNIKETLEYKHYKNIFFAGQINGTSGYEEAAIQGISAGINIYNTIVKKNIINTNRYKYLNILLKAITSKRIIEPYRIFNIVESYHNKKHIIDKNNLFKVNNKILLLINNLPNEGKYTIKKYNHYYDNVTIKQLFFNKSILKVNNFIKKIYCNESIFC